MNIVVVSDFLFPDVVGGSWNYAHEVAQRLAARGHRLWGISAHPGDNRPFREQVGAVAFHRYPLRRGSHLSSFASRVAGALRTVQQIASHHPIDVLHTHAPMGAVGALLAPSARAVPRIATVHGTGVLPEYLCELAALEKRGNEGMREGVKEGMRERGNDPGSRRSLVHSFTPSLVPSFAPSLVPSFPRRFAYCTAIDAVERWYLRRTRRAHALSRFSRDAFVGQHRLDPACFAVIPPGVDLERFRPGPRDAARRELGLPEERPILFTVRRLTARMGLDLLLRATQIGVSERPDLLLLIGGKGPMRAQLEQMISELGLQPNVSLCGFIPDTQLPLYYQAADLFVLPSTASEGFGLITLEALACDRPVLGTPVGAIPEVLAAFDPELIFPDTSASTMATHILSWLRRDPPCGTYREQVVEQFHWDRCMDRLEALFGSVIGERDG